MRSLGFLCRLVFVLCTSLGSDWTWTLEVSRGKDEGCCTVTMAGDGTGEYCKEASTTSMLLMCTTRWWEKKSK